MESRSVVNKLTPLAVRNPLTLGYLTRNRLFACLLAIFDQFLRVILISRTAESSRPQRILIANWGQLGDVFYASAIVSFTKQFFPEAEIGFLVSSAGSVALVGVQGIQHIHIVDHWLVSRSTMSRWKKLRYYFRTRQAALKNIRAVGYCVAIETFSHPPNSGSLLWQAGIPRVIGYPIGAGRRFFTDLVEWTHDPKRHVTEDHLRLFEVLLGRSSHLQIIPALLPTPDANSKALPLTLPTRFAMLHVGTGGPLKEWPIGKWIELARILSAQNVPLVFTGRGEREASAIQKILAESSDAKNLCDLLSYEAFVDVLKRATVIVGVDSVAAHLAGACDTPGVFIYHGMADILRWSPISKKCVVLSSPLPCSPCLSGRGCETMRCVRDVQPEEVADHCLQMFHT